MEDEKPVRKIHEDAPLRLKTAAEVAFPFGGMTESGLKREIQKGHLEVEVIAGKQFVTLRGIREMRERCRAIPGGGRSKDSVVGLTLKEEEALGVSASSLPVQQKIKHRPKKKRPTS